MQKAYNSWVKHNAETPRKIADAVARIQPTHHHNLTAHMNEAVILKEYHLKLQMAKKELIKAHKRLIQSKHADQKAQFHESQKNA